MCMFRSLKALPAKRFRLTWFTHIFTTGIIFILILSRANEIVYAYRRFIGNISENIWGGGKPLLYLTIPENCLQ